MNDYEYKIRKNSVDPSITLARNLILKGVALVYLIAFSSIYSQIQGLWGDEGVLPAKVLKQKIEENMSSTSTFFNIPSFSLFFGDIISQVLGFASTKIYGENVFRFFSDAENSIHITCLTGVILSLLVLIKSSWFSCKLSYFTLYVLYLNIYLIGQSFMGYPQDKLLLESGFICIGLAPMFGSRLDVISPLEDLSLSLIRFLNFKIAFTRGLTKISSGCTQWTTFNAYNYIFQTQPFPNAISYLLHWSSEPAKRAFSASLLAAQLYLPFCMNLPSQLRRVQIFAGSILFLFEFAVFLSGSNGFMGLLLLVINLSAFDDEFLRTAVPSFILRRTQIELFDNVKTKYIETSFKLPEEMEESPEYETEKLKLREQIMKERNDEFSKIQNQKDLNKRKETYESIMKSRADKYRKMEEELDLQFGNSDPIKKASLISRELSWFITLFSVFLLATFYFLYPIQDLVDGKLKITSTKDMRFTLNFVVMNLYVIFTFGILIGRFAFKEFVIIYFRSTRYSNGLLNLIQKTVYHITFVVTGLGFALYYISAATSLYNSIGFKITDNQLLNFQPIKTFEAQSNDIFKRFHCFSTYETKPVYGLTGRLELQIELTSASIKGENVVNEIKFAARPNEELKALPLISADFRRLDYQMHLASYKNDYNEEVWLIAILGKILEENDIIVDLLGYQTKGKLSFSELFPIQKYLTEKKNAFHTGQPTKLRIDLYSYLFNSKDDLQSKGKIWNKKKLKEYLPFINKDSLKQVFSTYDLPQISSKRVVRFHPFSFIPIFDIIVLGLLLRLLL